MLKQAWTGSNSGRESGWVRYRGHTHTHDYQTTHTQSYTAHTHKLPSNKYTSIHDIQMIIRQLTHKHAHTHTHSWTQTYSHSNPNRSFGKYGFPAPSDLCLSSVQTPLSDCCLNPQLLFIVQEELLWINRPISYYRFVSSMSRSQRGLEESQGRVSLMPGLTGIPSFLGMVPSSNLPWAEFQLGLRIF